MITQRPVFQKNKLVVAVGLVMLGGVISGCSSDSSPAAALYNLLVNGGTGGSADTGFSSGGNGGDVQLYNQGGTGGVEMRKAGKANANFTRPGQIKTGKAVLGDMPLAIAASTALDLVVDTLDDGDGGMAVAELYKGSDKVLRSSALGGVAVYASDPIAAGGTVYMSSDDDHVYTSSGTTTPDAAYTGLSVATGTTLTLGDNDGCGSRIVFDNDVDNAGTITKVANGCDLDIVADRYIATGSILNAGIDGDEDAGDIFVFANAIHNKGSIDSSGFSSTTTDGGDGGEVTLRANGFVINDGGINASGGDGMGDGGDGDQFDMDAQYVENNGTIDISGGNNTDVGTTGGNGGDGGYLDFSADFLVFNKGDVDGSGGDGDSGGDVNNTSSMTSDDVGDVRNVGNINLNGGMGTNITTGSGGDGGDLDLDAEGGHVLNSGDFTARGGDALNPAGNGGDGGDLELDVEEGEEDQAAGDIVLSGNIDLSGGNAVATGTGSGGNAGDLSANLDGGEAAQRVALLGYLSVESNGGPGGESGGYGGEINLDMDTFENDGTNEVTGGPVYNDVPLNLRGGDATSDGTVFGGEGGGAGGLIMVTDSGQDASGLTNLTAINKADINASGGAGVFRAGGTDYQGGYGGGVFINGNNGADNSGDLMLDGGAGAVDGGNGGGANIYSDKGPAKNSGDVAASGTNGGEWGGFGGYLYVEGTTASNSGDASVNGGNATNPGAVYTATFGGEGGYIYIHGQGITGASNTGTLSFAPGTGLTQDGDEGCAEVGIVFTGNCTD